MSSFTTQEGGGHTTAAGQKMYHVRGSCSFELQPRTQGDGTSDLPDDGLLSDEERTKRKKTRGAEKRTQYSNRKKAAVVAELRELEADHAEKMWHVQGVSCQQFLARKTGIPQPNICKWNGDAEKLIAAAANDLKKDLFKTGRERRWFGDAEEKLHSLLLQRRKRKLRVSTAWIRVNARKLLVAMYPDDPRAKNLSASDRWCRKFAKRHHLSKRRRTNMKNKSVEDRLPQTKSFHRRLRQLLQEPPIRRAAAGGAAENNGAAIVGLAFVNGLDSTWDETGALRVQIGQPFPGLEKRQCTVNCCIGAGDKLMRTAVIFRGKGKVSAVEKAAFLRSIKGEEVQHAAAATSPQVGRRTLTGRCRLWTPPQSRIGNELDEFLGHEENLCLWETNKLSAGARRILFTRFIARAVARMDRWPGYRHRLFEKTGLAMTADGSLDDRITPEGVVGAYNFMDGGTSSDEEMPDQDDEVSDDDGGAGGGESSCDSDASADDDGDDHGDVQAPLSQLDSDDDVDSDDDIIAMELPVGFRLQESPPENLDRALINRCVFLRRGMGWFLGQISRAAPPLSSHTHTYDYRVVLAYDQSTVNVKMPLDAHDVDEENAAVGAWALIEPIDDSNEPAGGCEGEQPRRQGSRARTPNGRNIDQPG
ncbi:unnamed protein product [Ectocarpus sp. CCAP 1310/34]|nr:unnamed protein product [Ectocarpus sp. CCAP 1310/34]